MQDFFHFAFGLFLLVSWCCIHFFGYPQWFLDIFHVFAGAMSNAELFLRDFWTFFIM